MRAIELQNENIKLKSYDNTIISALGDITNKKILDYGCGPGVLVSVLKNSKIGSTKEEIVKTVQDKRLVKENTILLNLQNRKVFKKTDDHRFILA